MSRCRRAQEQLPSCLVSVLVWTTLSCIDEVCWFSYLSLPMPLGTVAKYKCSSNVTGTQFGLFVYHYKHGGDQLPLRTAAIVNPTSLEAQLSQSCPLTVADTFVIEAYGTFHHFSPHASAQVHQEKALALQQGSTVEKLRHSTIIAQYLELHITAIIDTLGTNNNFIAATLRVAEMFSRPVGGKRKPMLRNALHIFTPRFLRRTYWVQPNAETGDYAVAWMDAPWRALPAATPRLWRRPRR